MQVDSSIKNCPSFSKVVSQLSTFDSTHSTLLSKRRKRGTISDQAWAQATLPLQLGGLGLYESSKIHSWAFFSSCNFSHFLVSELLLNSVMTFSEDKMFPLSEKL